MSHRSKQSINSTKMSNSHVWSSKLLLYFDGWIWYWSFKMRLHASVYCFRFPLIILSLEYQSLFHSFSPPTPLDIHTNVYKLLPRSARSWPPPSPHLCPICHYQYHKSRPTAAIAYACILRYCNNNIIHLKLLQEK